MNRIYDEAETQAAASPDLRVHDITHAHGKCYIVQTLGKCNINGLLRNIPDALRAGPLT